MNVRTKKRIIGISAIIIALLVVNLPSFTPFTRAASTNYQMTVYNNGTELTDSEIAREICITDSMTAKWNALQMNIGGGPVTSASLKIDDETTEVYDYAMFYTLATPQYYDTDAGDWADFTAAEYEYVTFDFPRPSYYSSGDIYDDFYDCDVYVSKDHGVTWEAFQRNLTQKYPDNAFSFTSDEIASGASIAFVYNYTHAVDDQRADKGDTSAAESEMTMTPGDRRYILTVTDYDYASSTDYSSDDVLLANLPGFKLTYTYIDGTAVEPGTFSSEVSLALPSSMDPDSVELYSIETRNTETTADDYFGSQIVGAAVDSTRKYMVFTADRDGYYVMTDKKVLNVVDAGFNLNANAYAAYAGSKFPSSSVASDLVVEEDGSITASDINAGVDLNESTLHVYKVHAPVFDNERNHAISTWMYDGFTLQYPIPEDVRPGDFVVLVSDNGTSWSVSSGTNIKDNEDAATYIRHSFSYGPFEGYKLIAFAQTQGGSSYTLTPDDQRGNPGDSSRCAASVTGGSLSADTTVTISDMSSNPGNESNFPSDAHQYFELSYSPALASDITYQLTLPLPTTMSLSNGTVQLFKITSATIVPTALSYDELSDDQIRFTVDSADTQYALIYNKASGTPTLTVNDLRSDISASSTASVSNTLTEDLYLTLSSKTSAFASSFRSALSAGGVSYDSVYPFDVSFKGADMTTDASGYGTLTTNLTFPTGVDTNTGHVYLYRFTNASDASTYQLIATLPVTATSQTSLSTTQLGNGAYALVYKARSSDEEFVDANVNDARTDKPNGISSTAQVLDSNYSTTQQLTIEGPSSGNLTTLVNSQLNPKNTDTFDEYNVYYKNTSTGTNDGYFAQTAIAMTIPSEMDLGKGSVTIYSLSESGTSLEYHPESTLNSSVPRVITFTATHAGKYGLLYTASDDTTPTAMSVDDERSPYGSTATVAAKDYKSGIQLVIEDTSDTTLENLVTARNPLGSGDIVEEYEIHYTDGSSRDTTITLTLPSSMNLNSGYIAGVYALSTSGTQAESLSFTVQRGAPNSVTFTGTHFSPYAVEYRANGSSSGASASSGSSASSGASASSGSSASSGTSASSGASASSGSSSGTSASSGSTGSSSGTGSSNSNSSTGGTASVNNNNSNSANGGNATVNISGYNGSGIHITVNGAGGAGQGGGMVPPGVGGKDGNYNDMPKTGDVDTYRILGGAILFLFGAFEIISSMSTRTTRKVNAQSGGRKE